MTTLIRITSGADPEAGVNIGELFTATNYPLDPREKWTLLEKVSSSSSHYEPESRNHYKVNAEKVRSIGNLAIPTKTEGGHTVTDFQILEQKKSRGILPPLVYRGMVNEIEVFWTSDGKVSNPKRYDCNVRIEHVGS